MRKTLYRFFMAPAVLKVFWHCLYKTFTDFFVEHHHVTIHYAKRPVHFCSCGYLMPEEVPAWFQEQYDHPESLDDL